MIGPMRNDLTTIERKDGNRCTMVTCDPDELVAPNHQVATFTTYTVTPTASIPVRRGTAAASRLAARA